MTSWYFTYGPSTIHERFVADHDVKEFQPANLEGHRLAFVITREGASVGTSCIIPSPSDFVMGVAYLVEDETLRKISALDGTKSACTKNVQIKGRTELSTVLVAKHIGDYCPPEDHYLAQIREGLTYFYPVTVVDSYLRKALGRNELFGDILVQRLSEATFKREYGCDFRRIFPWKSVVRTTNWGCAIGVLRPGEITTAHGHDEEEAAFILSGSCETTINGRSAKVGGGDVVFHPPDSIHTLRNISETDDLQVLFVWWGGREVEQHERFRLEQVGSLN